MMKPRPTCPRSHLRFILSLALGIGAAGLLSQTTTRARSSNQAEEKNHAPLQHAAESSKDRPCRSCGGSMRPTIFKPKSSPPQIIWQCLDYPDCIGAETIAGFAYTYASEDLDHAMKEAEGGRRADARQDGPAGPTVGPEGFRKPWGDHR
jgi:hypothetical protein